MSPAKTSREDRLLWLFRGIPGVSRAALSGLAGFLIAVWTTDGIEAMLTLPTAWWGVGAAAVLIALGVGHFTFLKPTYTDLAKLAERSEAELREARGSLQQTIDTLLLILLTQLKLDEASTRISAYSVELNEFVLVSRQSVNPDHEVRGRPWYPLRQGIIGKAWRNDSAVQFSSASSRAEWEAECVATHGFTQDEARGLTMVARSTLAIRLDTAGGEKVGMLVIESEDEDRERFPEKLIGRVRRGGIHDVIVNIIATSHEHFPRVRERAGERNGIKGAPPLLNEPVWKNPSGHI